MSRIYLWCCILCIPALAQAEDKPPVKEAPEVAAARKKLDTKITVSFKDTPFKEVLETIGQQVEVKFFRDVGIPGNKSITYEAKDKPAKDVLDDIFKKEGFGYVVYLPENKNDRNYGWLKVVNGEARLVEVKEPPKDPKNPPKDPKDPPKDPKDPPKDPKDPPKPEPGDMEERAAAAQLKLAKSFVEDGKFEDAVEYLEKLLKKYPSSKAAAEAKELLARLKKR